jgi:hypothetical protein
VTTAIVADPSRPVGIALLWSRTRRARRDFVPRAGSNPGTPRMTRLKTSLATSLASSSAKSHEMDLMRYLTRSPYRLDQDQLGKLLAGL